MPSFASIIGFGRIETKLDAVDTKLNAILKLQRETKELIMSEQEEIANLVTQVAANRDVAQSAMIAINGMLARIQEQNKQLAEAIANSSDVSPQIKAAADALAQTTAALADAVPHVEAAISANTKK